MFLKITKCKNMSGITLTFGEVAENHVGMQLLGQIAESGYSYEDLVRIQNIIGLESEIIDLSEMLTVEDKEKYGFSKVTDNPACILIIRNYCEYHTELFNELVLLDWDKKVSMRGKVVNKIARYNLCFDVFDQEPDYSNKKGRVINYNSIPLLSDLHSKISDLDDTHFKIEGNYYYDVLACGISFHGDAERRKVIGIRLGDSFDLAYCWYLNSERLSDILKIKLNSGDMYIMSDKAVGNDWKKRKIPTLRHASGSNKYTK